MKTVLSVYRNKITKEQYEEALAYDIIPQKSLLNRQSYLYQAVHRGR